MTTDIIAALKAKYQQLELDHKAARAALEKQIAEAQKAQQSEAIAKIKLLMEEHGLTADHLRSGPKKAKAAKPRKPVQAKYIGPEGQTWTGRGRQPKWLGEDKSKYLIK